MATPETSNGLKGEADEDASNVKPAILEMNDNPLIDNGTDSKHNAQNMPNEILDDETLDEEDKKDGVTTFNDVVSDGGAISPIVSNTDKIGLSLGA